MKKAACGGTLQEFAESHSKKKDYIQGRGSAKNGTNYYNQDRETGTVHKKNTGVDPVVINGRTETTPELSCASEGKGTEVN